MVAFMKMQKISIYINISLMTVSGTQNDLKFREYFLTAEVLFLGKITKNIMNIKPIAPKKAATI